MCKVRKVCSIVFYYDYGNLIETKKIKVRNYLEKLKKTVKAIILKELNQNSCLGIGNLN